MQKVTLRWLTQQAACAEGEDWYREHRQTDPRKLLEALIADDKFDWANWLIVRVMERPDYLRYAVFAAGQVIDLFGIQYPEDKRPRTAIEAARRCITDDSSANREAAREAAWAAARAAAKAAGAAKAAAWAAAWAAAEAAWAAEAAGEAAAWAAAAWAAADAAWAAAAAARVEHIDLLALAQRAIAEEDRMLVRKLRPRGEHYGDPNDDTKRSGECGSHMGD